MWMAENLNYDTLKGTGSWCYNNQDSNCVKYGRLYNWNTAKVACPSGWHLPSRKEWERLLIAAGGDEVKKLKATNGWNDNDNGTDDFGFSALPGGHRTTDGKFYNAGYNGYWWTATEYEYDDSRAYLRRMNGMGYDHDYVSEYHNFKDDGYSVRCVEGE